MSGAPDFVRPDLRDRVAIITGGSRGIGRACALALAGAGADVVVAAKSERGRDSLPGSIHETADAVRALGRRALPVRTDVRDPAQIEAMVAAAVAEFGRVDLLINNAGALHWRGIPDTPPKRFDLVHEVNVRAAYCAAHYALPHLLRADKEGGGFAERGAVVQMSPPLDLRFLGGKVAYGISKLGMSLLAIGLAQECGNAGLRSFSLWPATAIETAATINYGLGGPAQWRKPDIVADALLAALAAPLERVQGRCLVDEEVLAAAGVSDLARYLCVPDGVPLRIVGDAAASAVWKS